MSPVGQPLVVKNGRSRIANGKRERKMAGPTRLELATSGVTGRRSNQLNYDPDTSKPKLKNMVGGTGLEPVTPGL